MKRSLLLTPKLLIEANYFSEPRPFQYIKPRHVNGHDGVFLMGKFRKEKS